MGWVVFLSLNGATYFYPKKIERVKSTIKENIFNAHKATYRHFSDFISLIRALNKACSTYKLLILNNL